MTNPRFATPRAAYLHVPFCRHRCGYCNFTLIAGREDLVDRYLLAIEKELEQIEGPVGLETLYFGGGTPTHLEPHQFQQLSSIVKRRFDLLPGHEFTVEGNPLDINRARLDAMLKAAVNRLSLGVQSFSDQKLEILERDHRSSDIQQAIELARPHIASLSIDLIFGVPGETIRDWQKDLESALALRPDHVSVYGLTWEKGTSYWGRLQKGELSRCDDEAERAMYELAIDVLTDAGFEHYEVSNFARPGHRSRHNETYWMGRTYYAAGPGAARYVDGRREMNHRSTTTYVQRILNGESAIAESEFLTDEESARERFVFGLRRTEGVNEGLFREETGFSPRDLFEDAMGRFFEMGFLEMRGPVIRLTRGGLMISDSLWPYFLRV